MTDQNKLLLWVRPPCCWDTACVCKVSSSLLHCVRPPPSATLIRCSALACPRLPCTARRTITVLFAPDAVPARLAGRPSKLKETFASRKKSNVTKKIKGTILKPFKRLIFMDNLDDNLFQVISLFELDVKDNSTRTHPWEKILHSDSKSAVFESLR